MNIDEIREEFKQSSISNKDDLLQKGILPLKSVKDFEKVPIFIMRIQELYEEMYSQYLELFDLSLPQMSVLEMLFYSNKEYLTQNEISSMLFSSKANISTLLQRMEEKKLIERKINSKNKKQKLISITSLGNEKLKVISENYKQLTLEQKQFLNENDAKLLIDLLSKLHLNLLQIKQKNG